MAKIIYGYDTDKKNLQEAISLGAIDKELDKANLRKIIFSDQKKKEKLEAMRTYL